jgi:hypothetical protein
MGMGPSDATGYYMSLLNNTKNSQKDERTHMCESDNVKNVINKSLKQNETLGAYHGNTGSFCNYDVNGTRQKFKMSAEYTSVEGRI